MHHDYDEALQGIKDGKENLEECRAAVSDGEDRRHPREGQEGQDHTRAPQRRPAGRERTEQSVVVEAERLQPDTEDETVAIPDVSMLLLPQQIYLYMYIYTLIATIPIIYQHPYNNRLQGYNLKTYNP